MPRLNLKVNSNDIKNLLRRSESNLSGKAVDMKAIEEAGDDARFRRWFGGNKGYVGYSMSKRAEEAREHGRYPKTDFKKEYNVTQPSLDALVEADIIDDSEWHHTSKYGNRTKFYGWYGDKYRDIYSKNKKVIDKLSRGIDVDGTKFTEDVPNIGSFPVEGTEDEKESYYKKRHDSNYIQFKNKQKIAERIVDFFTKSATDNNGEFGSSDDIRFRMTRSKADFEAMQKRAEKERGLVMPGLNEAEVTITKVPRHDFKGEKPIEQAKKWAKDNLTGIHTATDSDGNQFKYRIAGRAIGKYCSESAIKESENLGVHLAVLKELPKVICESIEAEVHASYNKDANGVRRIEAGVNDAELVHRFYGAISIKGENGVYRVKTTMIEHKDSGRSASPHSYEVTEIEVLPDESESTSNGAQGSTSSREGSLGTAKLLKGVEKSYDKGVKLLEKSGMKSDDIRFRFIGEKGAECLDKAEEATMRLDNLGESAMGSKVSKRMKDIAERLENTDLDERQRAVVDVFTGAKDNERIEVNREDGHRTIIMRQGNEDGAGTKHSLYRHYGTGVGVIEAEDLKMVPKVIEEGKREPYKDSKTRKSYTLYVDGIEYTVATDEAGVTEKFVNFYTNRKLTTRPESKSSKELNTPNDATRNVDSFDDANLTNNSENQEFEAINNPNAEQKPRFRIADNEQSAQLNAKQKSGKTVELDEKMFDEDDTDVFEVARREADSADKIRFRVNENGQRELRSLKDIITERAIALAQQYSDNAELKDNALKW